jgi:hypothetical protein
LEEDLLKKLVIGLFFMALIVSLYVTSCNVATSSNRSIPTSSYPADIIGNVTVANTIVALNSKGIKQEVQPPRSTDVWWIVEISVKNKEYQQPIFATFDSSIPLPSGVGENTVWDLVYNGQIWSGGQTGPFPNFYSHVQNAILQGQTGTIWLAFDGQTDFNSANIQICYQGQEPFSYGQITIGNTVASYDWDSKKAISVVSTQTAKAITWSHTGYIKTDGFGNDNTTIVFQDGFSVSFEGALREDLLPPIGEKCTIVYGFDASTGQNNLISLNPAP